jgi:hypothetical protein
MLRRFALDGLIISIELRFLFVVVLAINTGGVVELVVSVAVNIGFSRAMYSDVSSRT